MMMMMMMRRRRRRRRRMRMTMTTTRTMMLLLMMLLLMMMMMKRRRRICIYNIHIYNYIYRGIIQKAESTLSFVLGLNSVQHNNRSVKTMTTNNRSVNLRSHGTLIGLVSGKIYRTPPYLIFGGKKSGFPLNGHWRRNKFRRIFGG